MAAVLDLAVSLASSLVYDGLKRPLKSIQDSRHRRKAISSALLSEDLPHLAHSDVLINDLTIVFANVTGEYTEAVERFFAELRRTGLPDALRHLVLSGKDTSILLPALDQLQNKFPGLPFDPEQFLRALSAGIRARIETSIKDPVLLEAVQAYAADTASQIEAIQTSLEAIGNSPIAIAMERIEDIRHRLARAIEQSNKNINVETTQGTKKILISRLVIPARLLQADETSPPAPHAPDNSINLTSFRRSFQRAVILGDPGGGKSTLTQSLCHIHAKQISGEISNSSRPKADDRELLLPLKVVLRSLERRRQQQANYSIMDYLCDEVHNAIGISRDEAELFLRYTLNFGQAIIFYDGLDEILSVDERRNTVSYIEMFSNSHALCPVLITSRIVGYRDAPMSSDFSIFSLAKFDREEVLRFAEKLISAIDSEKARFAADLSRKFLEQTERNAEDIRRNPLLLGLMVYIFLMRGDVPNNRPEIYKECSLLMFEKWDQRRDIIFPFPNDIELLDLFGFLASRIFGDAGTEDGVDSEWLSRNLKEFFLDWYSDQARATATAKTFQDFITGRAWVMCEIGPKVYKFTHRTFLEYFFARRLEQESGSVAALIKEHLYQKIVVSEWDVVSHLALQIATFRSGIKASQALDAFTDLLQSDARGPIEESRLLMFLAKALEHMVISEPRLKSVCSDVIRRSVAVALQYDLHAVEIISLLIENGRRRENVFYPVVEGELVPLAENVATRAGLVALYYMSTWTTNTENDFTLIQADAEVGLNRRFKETLFGQKENLFDIAARDIVSARYYLWLYRDRWLDLYNLHGFDLFMAPQSPLDPIDMSALLPLAFFNALPQHFGKRSRAVRPRISGGDAGFADHISELIAEGKINLTRDSSKYEFSDVAVSYAEELIFTSVDFHSQRGVYRDRVRDALVVAVFIFENSRRGGRPLRKGALAVGNPAMQRVLNAFDPTDDGSLKTRWLLRHLPSGVGPSAAARASFDGV